MNKKLYIIICIIFLLMFAVIRSNFVDGVSLNEIFQEKKYEIQEKIDNTIIEMQGLEEEISSVSEEVAELNKKIDAYQQEINQLNVQALQLQFNIDQTQQKLNQTEESYAQQKNLFEKRVIAMYKKGETAYLDVLLEASTIEEFISKWYYLTEVARMDQQIISNIQKLKEQVTSRRDKLLKQQENLKAVATNKERTAITLENSRIIRDSYIDKLSEEERENQIKLAQYEKDMSALEQNVLKISLSSMNEGYIGGNLMWPAPGNYIITSNYGMRVHPILHVQRVHTGVDIAAPEGTPVVAANGGVVTVAKSSLSYGNYIMIDHGGGVITLYAHALELLVSAGDIVNAGDVIMKVGSTGWSTGPHLHFEIRFNGSTVNPLPYIVETEDEKEEEKDINELFNELQESMKKDDLDENNAENITNNEENGLNIVENSDITN